MMNKNKELLHIDALTMVLDILLNTAWYSGKEFETKQNSIRQQIKELRSELAKEYYGYSDE